MRRLGLSAVLGLLVVGCTAQPERPDEGEMTGVLVSVNDACCWPSSGVARGTNNEAVALLPPDDFVRLWNAQHPDDDRGPITPEDWRAGSSRVRVPVEAFVEDADPGDEPLSGRIVEGRWRVRYDGDPVMVCVGHRGHEYRWTYTNGYGHSEKVSDREYLFLRCGLVDEPAPIGVTVGIGFGGIGVSADG